MTLTAIISLLRGFHHLQNSSFVLIALASDDTPGYVSKLQQVNETNLTSNLQDPFSQPCPQESHRFSDLPLLSHSAYLRKVVFFHQVLATKNRGLT